MGPWCHYIQGATESGLDAESRDRHRSWGDSVPEKARSNPARGFSVRWCVLEKSGPAIARTNVMLVTKRAGIPGGRRFKIRDSRRSKPCDQANPFLTTSFGAPALARVR